MILQNEYTFRSTDCIHDIRVLEWTPETEPHGIVQISHGVAEHVERYAHFANFLASAGFVVVANDHLGHGKSVNSEDELGFFAKTRGWDLVVSDIERLRIMTAEKYPNLPYFMLGHSMGSFLLRTHLIYYPDAPIKSAILSGTGHNPSIVVKAGGLVSKIESHRKYPKYRSKLLNDMAFGSYNKKIKPNKTVSDWISSDPEVVRAYVEDPLCGFVPSASLFSDLMQGLSFISTKTNLATMNKKLPIYIFSGSADPVGGYSKGVKKVYNMFIDAGMENVFCRFYDKGRHEMLNEPNKEDVYRDVLDWINLCLLK